LDIPCRNPLCARLTFSKKEVTERGMMCYHFTTDLMLYGGYHHMQGGSPAMIPMKIFSGAFVPMKTGWNACARGRNTYGDVDRFL